MRSYESKMQCKWIKGFIGAGKGIQQAHTSTWDITGRLKAVSSFLSVSALPLALKLFEAMVFRNSCIIVMQILVRAQCIATTGESRSDNFVADSLVLRLGPYQKNSDSKLKIVTIQYVQVARVGLHRFCGL